MTRSTSASESYVPGGIRAGWPAGWPAAGSMAAVQPAFIVAGLVSLAFFGRLAFRLAAGETAFLTQGYSFYVELATSALSGQGFCLANGAACAVRLPLYPAFLMPFIAGGGLYPGLAIAQAAIGAATVWIAWRIGRELFNARVGIIAAALAAISPYAIVHDTSLQDTVLVNFFLAAGAYLLWQAQRRQALTPWIFGGAAIAALMLTTARLTLVLPGIVVWALVSSGPTRQLRLRNAIVIALPVVMALGIWTLRNLSVVGAPVLTTESGESLWLANNKWAMAHFPQESIDLSVTDSYEGLTAAQHTSFAAVEHDEAVRDQLLRAWAIEEIAAHPGATLANAARKLWVVVSADLSPARGALTQWSYRLMFVPIHLLAIAGLWRHRENWATHSLAVAILVAFGITTAVFWAHTSHKSCLDVLLFVYAAAAFDRGAVRATP